MDNDNNLKQAEINAEITFVHPRSHFKWFFYPQKIDKLTVPFSDILTSVEILIVGDREYCPAEEEQYKANPAFRRKCDLTLFTYKLESKLRFYSLNLLLNKKNIFVLKVVRIYMYKV